MSWKNRESFAALVLTPLSRYSKKLHLDLEDLTVADFLQDLSTRYPEANLQNLMVACGERRASVQGRAPATWGCGSAAAASKRRLITKKFLHF